MPEAIDLRSLAPPGPLVRILDHIDSPGASEQAFLLTREPFPLYPLIGMAGWRYSVRVGEAAVILTVAPGGAPGV